eukprot:4947736-Pyramimonas_sp.AAC.1
MPLRAVRGSAEVSQRYRPRRLVAIPCVGSVRQIFAACVTLPDHAASRLVSLARGSGHSDDSRASLPIATVATSHGHS